MAMQNPAHPGDIVKRLCLEPPGLTVTPAASGLAVTHRALSKLVKGRPGISVKMAVRLSEVLGSTSETRPGMQMVYDRGRAHDRTGESTMERFAGK